MEQTGQSGKMGMMKDWPWVCHIAWIQCTGCSFHQRLPRIAQGMRILQVEGLDRSTALPAPGRSPAPPTFGFGPFKPLCNIRVQPASAVPPFAPYVGNHNNALGFPQDIFCLHSAIATLHARLPDRRFYTSVICMPSSFTAFQLEPRFLV